ncbi:MAG: hypothetical protein RIQ79_2468, partial [Verrucomicrobiota bacterium]
MNRKFFVLALAAALASSLPLFAQAPGTVLGDAIDPSVDFTKVESVYFQADNLTAFDAATGAGSLEWKRNARQAVAQFQMVARGFVGAKKNEFPGSQYDENPALPFQLSFVSPRTIRLRMSSRNFPLRDEASLMLAGAVPSDKSWRTEESGNTITYTSAAATVRVTRKPWSVEIRDAAGKLVTHTLRENERHTFSHWPTTAFVRRAEDLGRSTAATFALAHDEKIFGCGESFTRLDKRGQKVVCWTQDGMGVQTEKMYKPVPFYLSSAGYGVFVHTTAPVTFDFGRTFDEFGTIYNGDELMDLFIFVGGPKEILSEYTALTGRSPMPPVWSFGLWMSRITYKSETETREVAAKLRANKIPCDVIHLDTGWFETDWQCDYKFSPNRFTDPAKMLADLKRDGFRVSLWQYPYFTSKNALFAELVNQGLCVRDDGGRLPADDAVVDFSNPAATKWYQEKLAGLLKLGVSAIKTDFGEGAPTKGIYASGRTGYYEHNAYPLRYQQAAADITKEITGDTILWSRAAWAGAQRNPLHWGGDAENSDSAMAAELRGGLSFGLSGFTYWSHDVGGFVDKAPRELYRRWLAWGVLTSHTRCHGAPPREPWAYDEAFMNDFRRAVELKYTLMPYVLAQAKESSANGWPMLRALFFEFPNDAASWLVDDEYFFGHDLLVAPFFDDSGSRKV